MRYGASSDEWCHWDVFLNLTDDLLPVVCEPNLPISPNSTLKSYGKVPSIVSGQGFVVGLAKWTSRVTTDTDIAAWSADPRYGICLQTRKVRAIDVDVTDAALALCIRDTIRRWDSSLTWPVRIRSNSPKFLTLFELEGEFAKRRLETAYGYVEFLATGNQCLVAGTHSSGVRYEWDGGLPMSLPVLTEDRWDDLRETLEMVVGVGEWSEGRVAGKREGLGELVACDVAHDPVITYLRANGWVKR